MSEPRKSILFVKYNDKDISRLIANDLSNFFYTDNANGESDSVSISINDPEHKWSAGWLPEKKDTIFAQISTYNWKNDGDRNKLIFGTFMIDTLSVQSNPRSVEIGAISGPLQTGFRETKRTKTWEKATIGQIAKKICDKYKFKFIYDADIIKIKSLEQSGESDSSFLQNMCENYGLSMKAYKNKIVIFDREKYKLKKTAHTLNLENDVSDWSWEDNLVNVYTGGEMSYTDSKSGRTIKVKVGKTGNRYKSSESADNANDAKMKLVSAINNENHGKTHLSVNMMGDTTYVSGQCVNVVGVSSKINGKYYIDQIEHEVGGDGYKIKLSMSKVFEKIR